jgi:hypothetical protein
VFIPNNDRSEQESIFQCNLSFVFSNIFRLNYILFEENLRDDDPNFLFLETIKVAQPFGKKLFLIPRQRILAPLIIRTAKEEDSDDLTAICNSQSELRTKEHGDHFISEMISSQDKEKMCLVAENEEGKVVGMMSVSLRMDLTLLEHHFDLRPYGLFCKGDFCESVMAFQRHEKEKQFLNKEIKEIHEVERNKILKRTCSYQQNVRLLQLFVKENVEEQIEDFSAYLEERGAQKKKGLNQNILGKLVDKHMRLFKFQNPDEVFENILDDQVQTFIIAARDFLFRELNNFGLPEKYLEGRGHWQMWAQRQIKSKLEEQRSKGLLGKRRAKMVKKKRNDDGRANEIILPVGFDIEPFCKALKKFIEADQEVREKVVNFFLQNEKKLMELYCEKNGEMKLEKELEFESIIEGLEAGGFKLPEYIKVNLFSILVCFGSLKYRKDTMFFKEKKKFKFIQNKEKTIQASMVKQKVQVEPQFKLNQKSIYYIKLNDLLQAIDQILLEDSFFKNRDMNIIELEKTFQNEEAEALEEMGEDYESFGLSHYHEIREKGVQESIQSLPNHLLNAACINIFFMEKKFQQRATDFLPFIFTQIKDRDYLILTQPQLANETPLLSHFDLVHQKGNSNFGHSLYFFHRSNLFAQFLKVLPAMSDEIEYFHRKFFAQAPFDDDQQLREEVSSKVHFRLSQEKEEPPQVQEIFKLPSQTNLVSSKKFVPTSRIDLKLKDMYVHTLKRDKVSTIDRDNTQRSRIFKFDVNGKVVSKEKIEKSSTRRKMENQEKRRQFSKKYKNQLKFRKREKEKKRKTLKNRKFEEKSGKKK